MMHKLALVCIIIISSLLIGCPAVPDPPPLPPEATTGAMLVSHGKYLYRIGGETDTGSVSARTFYAPIPEDAGQALTWTETTPLPAGRAYGAAFAVGNLFYVVGGSDASGPTDTIFYTSISSKDGSLGFSGTPKFWENNQIRLPRALSHFSHALHDGRIFVIGGKTTSGVTDTIFHARVWQKGNIGNWYESPRRLPEPRFNTSAAILYDTSGQVAVVRLAVVGGIDEDGRVANDGVLCTVGTSGYLDAQVEAFALPKPLASPIASSHASQLMLAGGLDEQLQASAAAYRAELPFDSWETLVDQVPAEGPSLGHGQAALWYLDHDQAQGVPVRPYVLSAYIPQVPTVGPGSGIVQTDTTVTAIGEAGSTLFFSKDDGPWQTDLATLGKISTDCHVAFKSVVTGAGSESPAIQREYSVRPLGFLVHVSGSVAVSLVHEEDPVSYVDMYLTEDLYDGGATDLTAAWAKLRLFSPSEVEIRWKDASTCADELDCPYSADLQLSLFEEDLLAETIDVQGLPLIAASGSDGQPVRMKLQAGTYYFLLEDANGATGTSFALAVTRTE